MNRIVLCSAIWLLLSVSASLYGQSSADKLQVRFPGKRWSVVIDASGFAVKTKEMRDGRQYLAATNDKNGMYLSVTLERTRKKADPQTCPGYLQERVESSSGLGLEDVKYSTVGTITIAEYRVQRIGGYKLDQKHLIACTARDDVYIDIHLSKVQFRPEEEQLFTSLIEAVKIEDSSTN